MPQGQPGLQGRRRAGQQPARPLHLRLPAPDPGQPGQRRIGPRRMRQPDGADPRSLERHHPRQQRRGGSRSDGGASMNAPELITPPDEEVVAGNLLSYYEAIENASLGMLEAARTGDWDRVVKLEGACAVLIARLKHASADHPMGPTEQALKSRIMQRILVNDAEIRNLAEPWINELGSMMNGGTDPDKIPCPHPNMQRPRASQASLDDFRLSSSSEVEAMLQRMEAERCLVTLSTPDGLTFTTLLWGIDAPRGLISFSGDSTDTSLRSLLESDEIVAVVYLDRIKVQFDVEDLVQVKGQQHDVLNARMPSELFRFQRRSAFRVEPFAQHGPPATFSHPALPDMKVSLRVLDVSLSGVALFLPENVPAIEAGVQVNDCMLHFDGETELEVNLLIHYRTALHPDTRGARLGCEFVRINGQDRALQHYINQTQKRRIVLAS